MENPSAAPILENSNRANYFPLIFLGFSMFVLLITVGGYFYLKSQRPTISINVETPTETIPESSPAEVSIEDWPVFTKSNWGMSLKYPPSYKVIKDSPNVVEIGVGEYSYLTITINVQMYNESNLCQSETAELPCVDVSGHGQLQPVTDLTFGQKQAKSFYIENGVDNSYHVVTVFGQPTIQFKAYVAGGGLDKTFQQMLTTLEFN